MPILAPIPPPSTTYLPTGPDEWQAACASPQSGLTRGDILESVIGFTENRLVQRQLLRWLDVDISKIVHRKRYWWRKKTFLLNTVATNQFYDLNQNGAGPAPDLEEIVNVCWYVGATPAPQTFAYMQDSNHQNWQVSVSDIGVISSTQTAVQAAGAYVMVDVATGYVYTVTITPLGYLVAVPGGGVLNPIPNLNSPSYTWQIMLQNQVFSTSKVAPSMPFNRTQSTSDLAYEGNAFNLQGILNDPTMGHPDTYFAVPGRSQWIGLSPIPDNVYVLQGFFWSGYNPRFVPLTNLDNYLCQTIPLIPPPFHYCVLLALLKRCFLYLYGPGDARYKEIQIELESGDGAGGVLGDLDRFNEFSVQGYETWKDRTYADYVRSDRN
jgi:hypothetical protein